MRIIVAPDSFKECLGARAVAHAIRRGWLKAAPEDDVEVVPIADGGEGTTLVLVESQQGTLCTVEVSGPFGMPVMASYGLVDDGRVAIVEVAEASGMNQTPVGNRDALRATSFGTGELIKAAIASQPETLIVCLGGSATTDGGVGILQALGAQMLDSAGCAISPGGAGLSSLVRMNVAPAIHALAGIQLVVACDVSNALLGNEGAAAVFGPQKGATSEQIILLDENLRRFSDLADKAGHDIHSFPGSGAAGGIGGMMVGILGASLKSGVELVMETVNLEDKIRAADLVITGEGAIDHQSASGKTPAGVAALARKQGKPVIGLAGKLGNDLSALHGLGLTAAFSIISEPATLADALRMGEHNLERAAEQLARLVHGVRRL
ncbi:MAG TPA: glycerate kinase [Marinobacter sp.]|nr:glycerate kinase [Marinobacter sp.]